MNWKAILAGALGGVMIDVQAYYKARKHNPGAKFRVDLILMRAIMGAVTSGLTLAGLSEV